MGLPLDGVVREGDALRFRLEMIGAAYDGVIGESGTWSQGGRTWPLVFR